MKFALFYEVQTPKPLDQDDWDPGQEARKFEESLEELELADKSGFDYVFVAEHHFTGEYTHTSAPDVFLAAVAGRTRNIRLGTGIIQMPPGHNHPVRVAERISTLDCVSQGRVEFGTGVGNPAELEFFVEDVADGKAMWREGTEECLKMMTQTPYEGHTGEFFSFPLINVVPKPAQRPHPPLWLACVKLDTMAEAARAGMASMIVAFGGVEDTQKRVDAYWGAFNGGAGVEPIGEAVNPGVMATLNGMCAKTDREAAARDFAGAEYFNYAVRRSMALAKVGGGHIHREFAEAQVQNKLATASEMPNETFTSGFASPGAMIVGSPETFRKRLREFEATNVDAVCLIMQCGERRHEDIMESIELFGTQVAPEFHERHETEHRKWRERRLRKMRLPIKSSF